MPANPILLCMPTEALRDRVQQALARSGYRITTVATAPAAVAALGDGPIDLVVAEGLSVSGAIGSLHTASDAGPTPVLVMAPAGDVEARIAFLEAGADDVMSTEFTARELEGRVEALLIRFGRLRPLAERGAAAGEITAFFSPKGGVGTTTLAVNTAVLLAGGGAASGPHAGARTLLVDLDLQFGQVATHLNLAPRYDIGVLANDDQALGDPELARGYLTEHSSGVRVLAAPTNPDVDARITVDHIDRAFAVLRPSFDHIVVDLGNRLDARALAVLEQAETHVFIIFPEIAALRATSLALAFLAETAMLRAKTHFVVNHIFPKELLKTRDVENLLRARPAAEIPYTEVEMIRAANEGVPVVISRPTSAASQALQRLAQTVLGIDTQVPAEGRRSDGRRGLFGRR
jgi:pilus assembly protein CpaE